MMKDLLGKAVHNASEHHSVINMMAAHAQKIDIMRDYAEECE